MKSLAWTEMRMTQRIKKAYRELAKKYHPDMNPGDKEAEQKFKEGFRGVRGSQRSGEAKTVRPVWPRGL